MKTQNEGALLPAPNTTLNPILKSMKGLLIYGHSKYFIVPKSRADAALGNSTSRGRASLFTRWLYILLLLFGGIGWGYSQDVVDELEGLSLDIDEECTSFMTEVDADCEYSGARKSCYLMKPYDKTNLTKGISYTFCGAVDYYNKKRTVLFVGIYLNADRSDLVYTDLDSVKIVLGGDHRYTHNFTIPCEKNLVGLSLRVLDKKRAVISCKVWPVINTVDFIGMPAPITKLYCEPGNKTIVIDNPDDAGVLYYKDAESTSMEDVDRLMTSQELSGYTSVPKHTDGKFHITKNVGTTGTQLVYFLGNFETTCVARNNSFPSLITLMAIPNPPALQLLPSTLTKCKTDNNNINCDIPEVTYAILPHPDSIMDSLYVGTTDLPYGQFSIDSMEGKWLHSKHHEIPGLSGVRKVCYDDARYYTTPGSCVRYKYKMTINGKLQLKNLGGSSERFNEFNTLVEWDCDRMLMEKDIRLKMIAPKPKMFVRCSSSDSVKVQCQPGVDGIRVYQHINSSSPVNTVPMPPPFPGINDKYIYYNCGLEPQPVYQGNGFPPAPIYHPYNYENRFVIPPSLIDNDAKVFYMSYFRYTPNGVIESDRVPIGIMTVPNTFALTLGEYDLMKPVSDSCELASRVLLPDEDSLRHQIVGPVIDSVINLFNNMQVSLNDSVMVTNPIQVTGTTFDFQWSNPVNYQTGIPGVGQVCYDMLPPGPGTCAKYSLNLRLGISYKTQNVCMGAIGTGYVEDSITHCSRALADIDICKFMYPPKPEVFYVCDKDDTLDFCLEQPVEIFPEIIWEYNGNAVYNVPACVTRRYDKMILDATNSTTHENYMIFDCYTRTGQRKSESVPVVVICLDLDHPFPTTYAPITSPLTAADHELNQYCTNTTPEPSTFHDLSHDPTNIINHINGVFQTIENNTQQAIKVNANFDLDWLPYQDSIGNELYDKNGTTYRVCYGHLPPGPRTSGPDDKGRTYNGFLSSNITICVDYQNLVTPLPVDVSRYSDQYNLDTLGACLDSFPCKYPIAETRVHKIPDHIGTGCANGTPSLTDLNGCDHDGYQIACHPDNLTIGYQAPILGTNPTFTWTDEFNNPVPQISDPSIQNPTWDYDASLLSQQGSLIKLMCKMEYNQIGTGTPVTEYYCEFIYLCGHCASPRPQGEVENDICKDLKVVPNPVMDRAEVQWLGDSGHQLNFSITNPVGVTLKQMELEDKSSLIDLSGQMPGIYFGRLVIDNQHTCEIQISKL